MSYDDRLKGLAAIGMEAARAREPLPAAEHPRAAPLQVLAVGEIECHDGATLWHHDTAETIGTPTGQITRVQREHLHARFDPHDYEPEQPGDIEVWHTHDRGRSVGRVVHLEWGEGTPARILAVFTADELEADSWAGRDVFISPGTRRNERGRLVLDHIALVESTARIGASPVKWAGGDFSARSRWTRQTTPGYDLLLRADDARRKRSQGAGIPIVGHPGFDEQLEEQHRAATRPADPLLPEYMRHNGEDGLFYSGGGGEILRVA